MARGVNKLWCMEDDILISSIRLRLHEHLYNLNCPDDDSAIDTASTEFPDPSRRTLKDTDSVDGVLMGGAQLCIVLGLALKIHLPEHVEGGLLSDSATGSLGLDGPGELPSLFAASETEGLAVVAGGENLGLAVPDQAGEWQGLGGDVDDGARGLVRAARVDDGDAAVVGGKGQGVARR